MINKNILYPDTAHRVNVNTSARVNQEILKNTVARLDAIGTDFEKIETRLQELDREWDIERMIETQASTVLLTTLVLSATVSRKFLIATAIVAGFLLQHGVQGWCPPVPFLRKLGFRTQREIDDERSVLLGRLGIQPFRSYSSEEALSAIAHSQQH